MNAIIKFHKGLFRFPISIKLWPAILVFITIITSLTLHTSSSAKTKLNDFSTTKGKITVIKQGELGCYIDVVAKSKTYHFIGDHDYCYSSKVAKGVFVTVEWKMKKIDDCEGAYGCGKYKDMMSILDLKQTKF